MKLFVFVDAECQLGLRLLHCKMQKAAQWRLWVILRKKTERARMIEKLNERVKAIALKHPLHTAAIALVSLGLASLLLFLWLLRNPSNYEDCIWEAAKQPTERGVATTYNYCSRKFKAE